MFLKFDFHGCIWKMRSESIASGLSGSGRGSIAPGLRWIVHAVGAVTGGVPALASAKSMTHDRLLAVFFSAAKTASLVPV